MAGITRTSTELTPGEEAEILGRSIEAVAERTGAPPRRLPRAVLGAEPGHARARRGGRVPLRQLAHGRRLPALTGSAKATGIRWRGTVWGEPGQLVEVPVYWTLDDWPLFEPSDGRDGLRPPSAVLEIWLAELRYAYGHADGGVLTITMHPECIGRGHRMAMLETFIEQASALPGVEFERLDAVVARWSAAVGARRANSGQRR